VHDTVCVTGTKGKSTTTALVAHLLRAAGHRTGLVGNIGLPLLEVLDPQPAPEYWAVELSSYQTGEVARSGARPQVAVVLNLFPEHLDWHGSEQRYIEDKLRLVTEAAPRIAVLNAADPHLAALSLPDSEVVWFNQPQGWHMRARSCTAASSRCSIPATRRCRAATTAATCARCWPRWKRWGWTRWRWRRRCRTSVRCRTACSASAWRWPDLRQRFDQHHAACQPGRAGVLRRPAHRAAGGGHDRGLDWTDFMQHMAQRRRWRS
jgi:UDP-N-acetylmuramoylalanine--D-glutamate ligase